MARKAPDPHTGAQRLDHQSYQSDYPWERGGRVKERLFSGFLLINKDVLSCPVTEIHEAKLSSSYFEGKKVIFKPDK